MKLYSLKGINENYGIGIPMLKKMIRERTISVVKVGNKNFIKKEDIEEYITTNTKEKI